MLCCTLDGLISVVPLVPQVPRPIKCLLLIGRSLKPLQRWNSWERLLILWDDLRELFNLLSRARCSVTVFATWDKSLVILLAKKRRGNLNGPISIAWLDCNTWALSEVEHRKKSCISPTCNRFKVRLVLMTSLDFWVVPQTALQVGRPMSIYGHGTTIQV
jgi:hypothetical protein